MSKILSFIFVFCSLVAFGQDIPDAPNPPRLVNDFVGGLLSKDQIQSLENKLVAYNDSTSTQIVVVIVKTVQPLEISQYAYQLGVKWGVGQKGKNNGVVLLWAPGDRKVNIQTGNGMEGVLPDIYAKRIITNVIGPNFKELRYYEGLDQGVDEIMKYASGEYQADPQEDDGGVMTMIIFVLIIIFIFWLIGRNKNNRGGGGLFGDSGIPYSTYTGWGRQSGNWGGGGSSWGGGGGGGFGGFGGGGFGGGGASGDY
jgi:uncharacterized protein